VSHTVVALKSAKIAALNDALRKTLVGGKIVMTAGINALPDRTKAKVLSAVRLFADFNKDNDPHGEHDFAAFRVDGNRINFKIDYYDKSLEYGSEDPSDPATTTRVLTILLACEY
jgi:Protein of unknown function (DUF3768).